MKKILNNLITLCFFFMVCTALYSNENYEAQVDKDILDYCYNQCRMSFDRDDSQNEETRQLENDCIENCKFELSTSKTDSCEEAKGPVDLMAELNSDRYFKFVEIIKPGDKKVFQMGGNNYFSDPDEESKPNQPNVELTRPFEIQITEFTNNQLLLTIYDTPLWSKYIEKLINEELCKDSNDCYNYLKNNANKPAIYVSYDFITKSKRKGNDYDGILALLDKADPSHEYRLPTSAEWEYVARNGGNTDISDLIKKHSECLKGVNAKNTCDADLKEEQEKRVSEVAWYYGNSFDKTLGKSTTHKVATKAPTNGLYKGIYDLLGNVWEWTSDWYKEGYYQDIINEYGERAIENPAGPENGSDRAIRGGGWISSARFCRSANRNRYWPVDWDLDVGFRPVRTPKK